MPFQAVMDRCLVSPVQQDLVVRVQIFGNRDIDRAGQTIAAPGAKPIKGVFCPLLDLSLDLRVVGAEISHRGHRLVDFLATGESYQG